MKRNDSSKPDDDDLVWPGEPEPAGQLSLLTARLTEPEQAALRKYKLSGDCGVLPDAKDALTANRRLCETVFATPDEAYRAGLYLGRLPGDQLRELADIVPWGDIDGYIEDFDHAIRLALEATAADFGRWEADDAGERRFGDEFSLSGDQVAQLHEDWRAAYVARLIASMALMYGVNTTEPVGVPEEHGQPSIRATVTAFSAAARARRRAQEAEPR